MRALKIFISAFVLLQVLIVKGQEDSPTGYSSFFMLPSSKYEPAILGDDMKGVHINLVNAYVWAGNTTFTRGTIEQMYATFADEHMSIPLIFNPDMDDKFTAEEWGDFIDGLNGKNRLGFGTSLDLLNVSVRINKGGGDDAESKEELFTFSLGAGARYEFNFTYPNDIFELAWYGNKKYAGETLDFSFGVNSFAVMEYSLGVAMPLERFFTIPDFDFRAGLRAKYLQGIGSIYTERSDIGFYTDPDGKYMELTYDYLIHTSGVFSEAISEDSVALEEYYGSGAIPTAGTGFGADIGVSAHYKERFYANINVLDIGGINFDKATAGFTNSGSIRFEGAEVDNIFSDEATIDTSEFNDIVDNVEKIEGQTYRNPYPTRLRLHASYKIGAETPKGVKYHQHSFGITYIQGFKDLGNATTRPYLAGAYVYNARSHFEAGVNFGGLGFNKLESGLFVAVRAGFFRMGIGSGNLLTLWSRAGTGLDFNYNLTLAF
jgi:hypothetical protein